PSAPRNVVVHNPLKSITVSPGSVYGGFPATATVTLIAPSPKSGTLITLSSSDPSIASLPQNVLIGANATTTTFPISTAPVHGAIPITLSAQFHTVTVSTTLTVTGASVSSLSFYPSPVLGGGNVSGTVALDLPAPPGGAVISLSSSDPSLVTLPATVTIP